MGPRQTNVAYTVAGLCKMLDVSSKDVEEADSLGNVQNIDVFDLGLPCTWVKAVSGAEEECTTHRSIERHEQPDRVCGENKPGNVIVSAGGYHY
jgi:hypothetical protein